MKIRTILIAASFSSLIACNGSGTGSSATNSLLSSFPSNTSSGISNNLRVSLTDAPSKELKNVYVNINHVELFVRKGDNIGRVIVARDLGQVDLLTLRNGVLLPMDDIQFSSGTEISAIRLVLNSDNNYSVKSDDSICQMQTPSGQQSGIKIQLSQPFTLEDNSVYSMVMDFDAGKSVVIKGNGDCLLKPVLRLMTVTKTSTVIPQDNASDPTSSDGSANDPTVTVQPVTSGTDTNVGSTFEIPQDTASDPTVITAP